MPVNSVENYFGQLAIMQFINSIIDLLIVYLQA